MARVESRSEMRRFHLTRHAALVRTPQPTLRTLASSAASAWASRAAAACSSGLGRYFSDCFASDQLRSAGAPASWLRRRSRSLDTNGLAPTTPAGRTSGKALCCSSLVWRAAQPPLRSSPGPMCRRSRSGHRLRGASPSYPNSLLHATDGRHAAERVPGWLRSPGWGLSGKRGFAARAPSCRAARAGRRG